MRLFISLSLVFILCANSFAQETSDYKNINITLKNPELSVSVGVSPHYSKFQFANLHWQSYGIRRHYRSMNIKPLTNFKFKAGANGINLSYSLLTTFPLQPKYDVYESSGEILNTATYEEWTQEIGLEAKIFRNFNIGISYHDRTIRFNDYDSNATVEFEYNLQSQKNLLLTANNSFFFNNFSIKPSVSYSLHQWKQTGLSNSFYRNNPNERKIIDYSVPINGITDYFGVGLMVANDDIAKNISFNFRYDSFSNPMIENNRFLFGINYEFDVMERVINL